MKKKAIVLGCGLVGSAMARDLAADANFDTTVADVSEINLSRVGGVANLRTVRADLSGVENLRRILEPFDIVIGAMPSTLGFQTLRTAIECGKPLCDISFMIEDPTELDALAKERGVTVIFDCGVAPGLANMVIGHCASQLNETHDVAYYVGGLPRTRSWPYEYKAPFAPSDVIEEYTRPARMVEDGRVVVKPALSEPELMDFPRIGTLEAFNTDGLRTLLHTVKARNMKEKTLRYPGHCELMRVFRETGFFRKDEIDVRGRAVRPLDVMSKLLFEKWRLEPREEEFTILRVLVSGPSDGRHARYQYDLFDEYDAQTGIHSMARTTGFPNTIMARMIMQGEFSKAGVFPPEKIGAEPGMLDRMIRELEAKGVRIAGRVESSAVGPVRPGH
ncbi:MAG: saccharopine dehydrogenase NADP-binding domain-containing protein [Phycisphaerae bacterium]|nr:saccharopine dehydrogenase NADP-binding domain-containing protein [Phycisphaerae bacterium]